MIEGKRKVSSKRVLWLFFTSFRCLWSKSLDQQTLLWKRQRKTVVSLFVIIKKKRIGSYLLPAITSNAMLYHFAYYYQVIINCYTNFMILFYFPLALVRSNSSHCQLMDVFKSKESSKEKIFSGNTWKTELF